MTISQFPTIKRKKTSAQGPLSVVNKYGGCEHRRVQVDEKLAEVTCLDCKGRLNPHYVLALLAREDWRIRERWASYRAASETLKARGKCKCTHCGKMTPVPQMGKSYDIRQRAHDIYNSDDAPLSIAPAPDAKP